MVTLAWQLLVATQDSLVWQLLVAARDSWLWLALDYHQLADLLGCIEDLQDLMPT